ncbi:hypothetical protein H0H87_007641 [Tephrocybe sp. NHM501043]|nr:hypothetical protein H0H87_007641 [Tephrocybe sp. NHM501043]
MSVGCLEPQFFKAFINGFLKALPEGFSLDGWRPSPQTQGNFDEWDKLRDFLTRGFRTNLRDYWAAVFHGTWYSTFVLILSLSRDFEGTDACALPVLTPEEAQLSTSGASESFPPAHPLIVGSQPPKSIPRVHQLNPGQHTYQVLSELGLTEEQTHQLAHDGALGKEARSSVIPGNKL